MFDSFYTTEKKGSTRCLKGHPLKDDWQTKRFDCSLAEYHLGDVVDPEIIEAKIWVYTYCKPCEKGYGRYIIIKQTKYVGFTEIDEEIIDLPNGDNMYVLRRKRGLNKDGI